MTSGVVVSCIAAHVSTTLIFNCLMCPASSQHGFYTKFTIVSPPHISCPTTPKCSSWDARCFLVTLARSAVCVTLEATSRSIELLCQGASELAKAVTFFGPGIVVLPMFGRISNVKDERALTYEAHPKRATQDGLVDRTDLQSRFGRIDPQRLIEELSGGGQWLEDRLKVVSDEDLQDEVEGLQDWKAKVRFKPCLLNTTELRATVSPSRGSGSP